jgi:hypothetical protein
MAEYAKDKRKEKYKPIGRAASGTPLYRGRVDDLRSGIRSQRRGFDVEVALTQKQAKNLSGLVDKARSEGVVVNVVKGMKGMKELGYSLKSTGSTNVAGGFAQTADKTGEYRGKAAQAKFEEYGGKVVAMKKDKPLTGKIVMPRPGKNIKGVRLAPNYFGIFNRVKPRIVSKKRKGKFGEK